MESWPQERFVLVFSKNDTPRNDAGSDPLERARLVLVRPGQPTRWREFVTDIPTVTPEVAEEVFEAVYQALASQEVTLVDDDTE